MPFSNLLNGDDSMNFEVKKMGKLADQLEELAYGWAHSDVLEDFGISALEELTEEQITEIYEYSESEECFEGYVGMALRGMCDSLE